MKKVMFVCKKNSAHSQMAEGFAKTLGKDESLSSVSPARLCLDPD